MEVMSYNSYDMSTVWEICGVTGVHLLWLILLIKWFWLMKTFFLAHCINVAGGMR